MAQPSFSSYLSSFKSIATLFVAGVGALIPGAMQYAGLAPPFLAPVPFLAPSIAIATIIIVYYLNRPVPGPAPGGARLPPLIKSGGQWLLTSVVLLVAYLILLNYTTSVDPVEQTRYQIGFYREAFGLTDLGRSKNSSDSVEDWILQCACYGDLGKIWRPWSIVLAGSLLIFVFLSAFTFWTGGWSLLAKHHAWANSKP
jgi:hypothetical protein